MLIVLSSTGNSLHEYGKCDVRGYTVNTLRAHRFNVGGGTILKRTSVLIIVPPLTLCEY